MSTAIIPKSFIFSTNIILKPLIDEIYTYELAIALKELCVSGEISRLRDGAR